MYKLIIATILMLTAFQLIAAQGSAKKNITGRYAFSNPSAENSMYVKKLSGGRVKIYLYASWIGSVEMGNVRTGEIKATLRLRNNVAVYESGQCRITIRFTGRRAIVTQSEDDCGFGLNVLAEGTYTKRSSRTPKFDF